MDDQATGVPATMRALLKTDPVAGYSMDTLPVPQPHGDQVLIKVDAVSLCGSDIVLHQWTDLAQMIATLPFSPGHECAGTVVRAGPDATLAAGQRVAVENHFYCGQCFQCKHGRGDICQDMGQYGHGRKTVHGGCSQYSIVPSKYCYPITTSSISNDEAVLLEPLGVAHNAIEQLEVENEAVLIQGCGPVGLFGCAVAKALGASKVIMSDINTERLQRAKAMGADITVDLGTSDLYKTIMDETGDDGIGRICEMSGSDSAISSMFRLLRKGGSVVMVGLPKQPLHVDNAAKEIVFKALQLRTVHGRRIFHTWEQCERLLVEKKIDISHVVSHRLPMSQYEEAFRLLLSGEACKIIMDPQN